MEGTLLFSSAALALMTYYVAVHGGAGFHSIEDEKEVRKALRRYEILQNN